MDNQQIINKLEDLADSMHCCILKEASTPVGQIMFWKMKVREIIKQVRESNEQN